MGPPFETHPFGRQKMSSLATYGTPKRRTIRGKRSAVYYCRVYDPALGRNSWISTQCKTREAAVEWRRTREIQEGLGPDRAREQEIQKITFVEAYERWLEAKDGQVGDWHFKKIDGMRRFWVSWFGKMRLSEVTAPMIREYLRLRKKGTLPGEARTERLLTATTVNNDLTLLRCFFRFCDEEGFLSSKNPSTAVKRHSGEPKRRIRTLSPEDEERLLNACRREPRIVSIKAKRNAGGIEGGKSTAEPTKWDQTAAGAPLYLAPMVICGLHAGLRRGTITALRWKHFDTKRRRWRIPAEITKANRDLQVPMSRAVAQALDEYRRALVKEAKKPVKKGQEPINLTERLARDALVFGVTDIGKSYPAAVKRAGLGGLTFHDLRRCFTTRLATANVPMERAMELTQHKNIETVQKHYLEIHADQLDNDVDALDGENADRRQRAGVGG